MAHDHVIWGEEGWVAPSVPNKFKWWQFKAREPWEHFYTWPLRPFGGPRGHWMPWSRPPRPPKGHNQTLPGKIKPVGAFRSQTDMRAWSLSTEVYRAIALLLWNQLTSNLTWLVFHSTSYFLHKLGVKTWTTFLRNPPQVMNLTGWLDLVTEAIYDVRGSHNCPRTFALCTLFDNARWFVCRPRPC